MGIFLEMQQHNLMVITKIVLNSFDRSRDSLVNIEKRLGTRGL